MPASLNYIAPELNPPGAVPLVVAVVIGGLVGLAFVPVAAVGLGLSLLLITVRSAWRVALRWIGLTPGHGVPADRG